MLNAATVVKIASPGKSTSHQAYSRCSRAVESMLPHDAVGERDAEAEERQGGFGEDGDRDAEARGDETGARALGSRWRKMMRASCAPLARAAWA